MPSTLSWIDHDAAERERMQRVLRMFEEAGTQDQLGLGGIRDAISDRLFPGVSTVQTRLRYFLFVAWIYRRIENEAVPSKKAAARARELEVELIAPLKASGSDGILGGVAGTSLKILPSAIYWTGLRSWGIRLFKGSRGTYHRELDDLYVRRKHNRGDPDGDPGRWATWHPALPGAPASFPDEVDMSLRREEAEFIQARLLAEHPHTLLGHLARDGDPTRVDYPWNHPAYVSFRDIQKRLLHHGRLLSEVKHGAALLYNLVVARAAEHQERIEELGESLREWRQALDMATFETWSLDELWELTMNQGHTISPATRRFVEEWVRLVVTSHDLSRDEDAVRLVRLREMRLKGTRSKFENVKALEEKWSGQDGVGRLDYRWSNVQTHLNDLYTGLAA